MLRAGKSIYLYCEVFLQFGQCVLIVYIITVFTDAWAVFRRIVRDIPKYTSGPTRIVHIGPESAVNASTGRVSFIGNQVTSFGYPLGNRRNVSKN